MKKLLRAFIIAFGCGVWFWTVWITMHVFFEKENFLGGSVLGLISLTILIYGIEEIKEKTNG